MSPDLRAPEAYGTIPVAHINISLVNAAVTHEYIRRNARWNGWTDSRRVLGWMATAELAATYAALILADDGVEITSDKIVALTNAAGVELEPIWATLLAKALEGKNVKDLLSNVGGGGAPAAGGAAPAAAAAGGAAPQKRPRRRRRRRGRVR
ncbi:60s Acidic ribosomal protein [Ceratobasidium sp. AG-Ba]|nr:60s Acidic ribosomal protein [Ceratobasidium sp. AG-Ba]